MSRDTFVIEAEGSTEALDLLYEYLGDLIEKAKSPHHWGDLRLKSATLGVSSDFGGDRPPQEEPLQ